MTRDTVRAYQRAKLRDCQDDRDAWHAKAEGRRWGASYALLALSLPEPPEARIAAAVTILQAVMDGRWDTYSEETP